MSRIVIDGRELRTSTGRYVERLLNYLIILDKANEYNVLLTPKDLPDWYDVENFKKVECPIKEFTFAEQTQLNRQLRGLKPDLVHFAMPQQPIRYKGKIITTVHDLTTLRFVNPSKNYLVFKFKQKVFSYVIKRAARKSFRVITPSQFVKDDLVKFAGINPDKVVVTYESADPINEPSESAVGLGNRQFLMYIGRPTPHKNLNRLIDAFVSLRQKHPDLLLVLAGKKDDNYKRIEEDLNQRGIEGVVFTGFVREGQLRWLYENCAAYVFPSLSEGFGLPGLEAMLHGAPVVSSNATCLPEIYGDAAQYFDPLDTEAMARAIDIVLSDQGLRRQLIASGYEQVKKYSWERMARQTLEIYKQALAN